MSECATLNPQSVSARNIPLHWKPALNHTFRLQWEPAQDCHVLLYPEGMVKLNPSAGIILSLCDGELSVQAIIEQLRRRFPEAEDIDQDILAFLAEARHNLWLNP